VQPVRAAKCIPKASTGLPVNVSIRPRIESLRDDDVEEESLLTLLRGPCPRPQSQEASIRAFLGDAHGGF
jgi:hypothetical protein